MTLMMRVYLAGPDVFYPDAKERGECLKALCCEMGLEGVYPLDSELELEKLDPLRQGYAIYKANIQLIRSCRAVMANMNPFRGPSMDVGTAFEMGFGSALGLIVVGYMDDKTLYKSRVSPDGLHIEDFGMVDNLMLHGCTGGDIFTTPRGALEAIRLLLLR